MWYASRRRDGRHQSVWHACDGAATNRCRRRDRNRQKTVTARRWASAAIAHDAVPFTTIDDSIRRSALRAHSLPPLVGGCSIPHQPRLLRFTSLNARIGDVSTSARTAGSSPGDAAPARPRASRAPPPGLSLPAAALAARRFATTYLQGGGGSAASRAGAPFDCAVVPLVVNRWTKTISDEPRRF